MQTVVAPAGTKVGGNLGLLVVGAVLAPERAVERMQDKIYDQRVGADVGILQCLAQGRYEADFLISKRARDRFLVRRFAVFFFEQASIARLMETVAPVADEAMRENAAVVTTMAIVVGAGEGRKDRFELRRCARGDGFCQTGEIGDTEHADRAVAPRLNCKPIDQIASFADFLRPH